jgi:anti-sigma factor RsiW
MEPEFDKIIDALLRSSPKDGGDLGASAVHLDADEISAFAENALPPAARSNYITHFADCGRCRNLLANVIAMNAEDAPANAKTAAAPAPLPVAAAEPWYKWLFRTPNLAAAMGVLVLVFSGFIGYIVLRDSTHQSATISQVREEAPRQAARVQAKILSIPPNCRCRTRMYPPIRTPQLRAAGGGGGRDE